MLSEKQEKYIEKWGNKSLVGNLIKDNYNIKKDKMRFNNRTNDYATLDASKTKFE